MATVLWLPTPGSVSYTHLTGVAATELALLAGADRVEGTLFGNGERTGNVDILNIAYNMFSQGIDPKLDIENVREIAEVYERCTKMTIDPRRCV